MEYEIYDGIKVGLNHVTPNTVKKYQSLLREEGERSNETIKEIIKKELPNKMKDDAITETDIYSIISKAIDENVVASLDIFVKKDFVDKWVGVVFNITPEQIKKLEEDFDNKFYWDEFNRGYLDFFGRLRGLSVK